MVWMDFEHAVPAPVDHLLVVVFNKNIHKLKFTVRETDSPCRCILNPKYRRFSNKLHDEELTGGHFFNACGNFFSVSRGTKTPVSSALTQTRADTAQ